MNKILCNFRSIVVFIDICTCIIAIGALISGRRVYHIFIDCDYLCHMYLRDCRRAKGGR